MRNLQGVVCFVESAAHGSFTAAANRLELTPAAVSKNVQRLEQQLQVRLFNRTTRRLTLTAEGEAVADSARQALRALDDAVSGVSRAGSEAAGRVRISVGMAFGRRHVLPAQPALHLRPQDMPAAWRAEHQAKATPPLAGETPAAAATTPPRRRRNPRR